MTTTRVAIRTTTDSAWVSATDLMAGLMIVFMFISIAFMKNVSNIAEDWAKTKDEIYTALQHEFHDDLPKWNAEIEKETLIVRFKEPTVLFAQGRAKLTDRFEEILRDFFPRYTRVLHSYAEEISEIRIEGHTSSEWDETEIGAYFENLNLSQERSMEVLVFSLSRLPTKAQHYEWTRGLLVAAGFSSSKLVVDAATGVEDVDASRRVEFRVRTNAEEKLTQIVGQALDGNE